MKSATRVWTPNSGARCLLGLPLGPGVENLEPIANIELGDRLELRETFLLDTTGHPSSLRVQVTATGRDAEKWRHILAHEGAEGCARQREQLYRQVYSSA